MKAKWMLIIKVPAGLNILDTPRPIAAGARVRRAEPVGTQLYAYDIFKFGGVEYAYLIPREEHKPEWCRVGEVIGLQYVEKIELESAGENALQQSIDQLTAAILSLKAIVVK